LFLLIFESHGGRALGADSEEKHEPVSDIDTAAADSLKVLDPERPIREADMLCPTKIGRFAPKAVSPTDFALSNSSTRPARAKSYFWADLIERSA